MPRSGGGRDELLEPFEVRVVPAGEIELVAAVGGALGVRMRGQGPMYFSGLGASVFFSILNEPGTSRYVPEKVRVRLRPRACSSSR